MLSRDKSVLKKLQRMIRDRLSRRRNRSWATFNAGIGNEYIYRNGSSKCYCCFFNCCKDCFQLAWGCCVPLLLILFVTYIFFFRGTHIVSKIKYNIGWYGPTVMVISVLDSSDDENFPSSDISGEEEDTSSLKKIAYEDRITWKVDGFSKYIHNSSLDHNEAAFGDHWKILTEKVQLDLAVTNISGLWIAGNTEMDRLLTQSTPPTIRALMITDHVREKADNLEVAIVLRTAIIGEATFLIKFEDSISNKVHTERISTEIFKGKGFCNFIFNVPFDKRVNTVQLRPAFENTDDNAMILVDKVIIIVAKRGITESITYSMVPEEWC